MKPTTKTPAHWTADPEALHAWLVAELVAWHEAGYTSGAAAANWHRLVGHFARMMRRTRATVTEELKAIAREQLAGGDPVARTLSARFRGERVKLEPAELETVRVRFRGNWLTLADLAAQGGKL